MDPGWIHRAAAAIILQSLERRKFDVGTIADEFVDAIPGGESSPEPAELLSRILAHIGHRLPLIRRVEKRLEGTEAKAGFGSDLTALFVQLYMRNRDVIAVLVRHYREQQQPPKEGQQ